MHHGRPPCSRRLEQRNWGPDPALTRIRFMKKESRDGVCLWIQTGSFSLTLHPFQHPPAIILILPPGSVIRFLSSAARRSERIRLRLVAPTGRLTLLLFVNHAAWPTLGTALLFMRCCRVKWHLTPQKYFLCQFSFPLSCIFQHLALRQ